MKRKFWYLTKASLLKKITGKAFIISNIILILTIISLTNIDSIIKFFGGDFNEETIITIVDNTEYNLDSKLATGFTSIIPLTDFSGKTNFVTSNQELSVLEQEILDTNNIIITFTTDIEDIFSTKIISEQYIDPLLYQSLLTALNSIKIAESLDLSGISPEVIAKIYEPLVIDRIILDEEKSSEGENLDAIMGVVFPIIILPFFMLSMILIQMIGAEINNEKSTRGMEIIISSVSPKVHLFSKIIAGNIFVFLQAGILFISGIIGMLIRNGLSNTEGVSSFTKEISTVITTMRETGVLDNIATAGILTIGLMALTFLAYSLLAAIFASVTTSPEDFQQVQVPIIIISLIGYYLSIMSGFFQGSSFILFMAHVPFISALLAPALYIMEDISIYNLLAAIVIMIGVNLLLLKRGIHIYKVGILNYSSSKLWKKMAKALKSK